jgi:putative alpha-1,2-mannosidase
MGFYPVCPGSGEYVIGSPMFSKITLNLPAPYSKKITISAPGVEKGEKYIKSLKMDGRPITKPFIAHSDLVTCNELVFEMSATPSEWGK